MRLKQVIEFPAEHPVFPGHFSGEPLVPGAVLLDHAIALVEEKSNCQVTLVRTAKFLRPLSPGECCDLQLTARQDGALKLSCRLETAEIMTAVLEVEEGPACP